MYTEYIYLVETNSFKAVCILSNYLLQSRTNAIYNVAGM